MTALIGRRAFLRTAVLAVAGAPLLAARPLVAGELDPGVDREFPHGVGSGDPGADRVVLWTRVRLWRSRPRAVAWRVASDPGLREVVSAGTAEARPESDGSVQVEVAGLEPGTPYWFAFSVDGHDGPTGRTRTLPGRDATSVRLAVLSCGNHEAGWFNAYARVAERDDLDLVVHLGDYVYEYGDVPEAMTPVLGRAHVPRVELRTLADYRRRYAQYRADPDLQRLHGRHAVVALWDDHEVADDSWATGAQAHGVEDGAFGDRRTAAMTAWREWHPRSTDQADPWRAFQLGGLVDASVVDGRSHRPHRGDPTIAGSADDAFGPTQRQWLERRLESPTAAWPIVLTQQPVSHRVDVDGSPIGIAGWSGFPASQAALVGAAAATRALIVSGDVHSSWLLDSGSTVEAVVPSVTSRSFGDTHDAGETTARMSELRSANPSVRWLDLRQHGYVIIDADRDRCRIEWWFVDSVTERGGNQHLAHAHEIPASWRSTTSV